MIPRAGVGVGEGIGEGADVAVGNGDGCDPPSLPVQPGANIMRSRNRSQGRLSLNAVNLPAAPPLACAVPCFKRTAVITDLFHLRTGVSSIKNAHPPSRSLT